MNKLTSCIIKAIIIMLLFIFLLPLVWTVYVSLVNNDLNIKTSLMDISKYTLDNYKYILNNSDIMRWLFNSIFVTCIITFFNLIFNSLAGFALAKYDGFGNKMSLFYVMVLIMIPVQALMIPTFIVISQLGLINSYAGLIIPFLINPFGVFLMRQYFMNYPNELLEAGRIDGLSLFQTLKNIVFPTAATALITQGLIIFIWNWNAYIFPSIIIKSDELFTLPLGISLITNTKYIPQTTIAMAGTVITLVPIIIVFVVMQKYIISSDVDSGIK